VALYPEIILPFGVSFIGYPFSIMLLRRIITHLIFTIPTIPSATKITKPTAFTNGIQGSVSAPARSRPVAIVNAIMIFILSTSSKKKAGRDFSQSALLCRLCSGDAVPYFYSRSDQ
jgi:hypothetical protein